MKISKYFNKCKAKILKIILLYLLAHTTHFFTNADHENGGNLTIIFVTYLFFLY